MRVRALKTYRCGEPGKNSKAPPKPIEKLMVEHLGKHGRIFEGGLYPAMPDDLAKALVKDKAAEEV